jgi:gluconate 2-dehydrogenase gamma chain
MKRRSFLQFSALLTGTTLFASEIGVYALHVNVLEEPYQTIAKVHEDLFTPSVGMPRPQDFNAIGFLRAVMHDKRVSKKEKTLLKNGVKWLDMDAKQHHLKRYIRLDKKQREDVLQRISQKQWGNDWIWYVMNHAFEAMLSDPVYGSNTDEIGWKWLGFVPGIPRPPKVNDAV